MTVINLKDDVYSALTSNQALISMLGGAYIWQLFVPNSQADQFPRITFFEIDNFDNHYAEDSAYASRILYQIDLWTKIGKTTTTDMRAEVDKTMKTLGFTRGSSRDLYESETSILHTVLRYKTTKTY